MDNENLNNLEADINSKNAVEERVRNLHAQKKQAEDKAEAETKAKQEALDKLAVMEKETKFLTSFSEVNAKFPGANDFKDKIKEKFNSGYSIEDATIATLHSEGKLNNREGNTAGGSAPNQIISPAAKSPKEMASADRWEALKEAEKRGDISLT